MCTNSKVGIVKPAYDRVVEAMVSKGSGRKFAVSSADGWDLGDPIGEGATVRAAVIDLIEWWQCKRDELIKVVIVDSKPW